MRTHERISNDPASRRVEGSLAAAGRLLWKHDCACVPIVDEHGRLHGMLTERDIRMAAVASGRRLRELMVSDVLASVRARKIGTTPAQASLREVEMVLRANEVRRLLVLDARCRVIGLLSSNDLCRWVDDGGSNVAREAVAARLVRTLADVVCRRVPAAVHEPASPAQSIAPKLTGPA